MNLIFVVALIRAFGVSLPATPVSTPERSMYADTIPYPAGYRRWTHIKSEGVGPQSPSFANNGGIHHIHANTQALEGYLAGKFPDGAVIVVDWMETTDSAGVIREGARRRIDVMMKDSQRFASTGGWTYDQFKGDSETERLITPAIAARCAACHARQKDNDYVFSKLRK